MNYSHTDVIVLIGFSGVGKTHWGQYIAEQLGKPFYDCDAILVSQEKMSVSEIFRRYGESYFRAKERDVIEQLVARRSCVIATGGGAVEHADFLKLVNNSHVWFLDESLERITSRMCAQETESRPLWENREALWARRYPMYKHAAHVCTSSEKDAIDAHIRELHHV